MSLIWIVIFFCKIFCRFCKWGRGFFLFICWLLSFFVKVVVWVLIIFMVFLIGENFCDLDFIIIKWFIRDGKGFLVYKIVCFFYWFFKFFWDFLFFVKGVLNKNWLKICVLNVDEDFLDCFFCLFFKFLFFVIGLIDVICK